MGIVCVYLVEILLELILGPITPRTHNIKRGEERVTAHPGCVQVGNYPSLHLLLTGG